MRRHARPPETHNDSSGCIAHINADECFGRCPRRGGRPYYGGWYAPYWGLIGVQPTAGYYYGHPNAGEVKLDTKVKDAQVFINGSFAGTTHQNRSMYLRPGSYNIEISEGGHTQFAQKVYVIAGKTLHLHPEL
jgi:PEGA domain-containing protein